MDEDDHLTPADRDAIVAAAQGGTDRFLRDLLLLADSGIALSVGLLLNGMVVFGALGRLEEAAADLSAARGTAFANISKPDEMSDDEWEETRRNFLAVPHMRVEKFREAITAIEAEKAEHGEDKHVTELPAALGRRVVEASIRKHITLVNANIMAAGVTGPTNVPMMRVAVEHIAAWWPLHFDENGVSTTRMWAG